VPKVIDFGVAKATEQKLTERTLFTQYGTMVGTFEYMSPEQAEMSALGVDTRSDIYSLGVLLYELLTGSTPLTHKRIKEAAYAEILRMIKEEEPPRPSTRLSDSGETLASISAQRQMEPAKLTKLVRGELDWIVMKTLEKDRNRRYETAKDFAADVQRYLNDEPVQACPPSALYRFRKFTRRNRVALVIATLAAMVLVLAMVGLLVSNLLITRQRDIARSQRRLARNAVDKMFTQVAENWLAHRAGLEPLQREFLEEALRFYQELSEEVNADPEVRLETANAYRRVGEIYDKFGENARGADAFNRRLENQGMAEEPLLDEPAETAKAQDAFKRALALLEPLVNEFPSEARFREALARTHQSHASVLLNLWRRGEAITEQRRAVQLWTELAEQFPALPAYPQSLARAHGTLGVVLFESGQNEQSVGACRRALQLFEALPAGAANLPVCRSERCNCVLTLSFALESLGRRQEAEETISQAVTLYQNLVADFPYEPSYQYDLGTAHYRLGCCLADRRPAEAETALRKALSIGEKVRIHSPRVPLYRGLPQEAAQTLAFLLKRTRRLPEGAELLQREMDVLQKLGAQTSDPSYLLHLAWTYKERAQLYGGEQPKLSESDCRRAIEIYTDYLEAHPDRVACWMCRGGIYVLLGEWGKAAVDFSRAIELNPNHWGLRALRCAVDLQLHEYEQAVVDSSKGIEINGNVWSLWRQRGEAHLGLGLLDKAIADYREASRLKPDIPQTFQRLGSLLERKGDWGEAIAAYRKAIELDPKNAVAHYNVARAYALLGQWGQATAHTGKQIPLRPSDNILWMTHATFLLRADDTKGYRLACQQMIDKFGQTKNPFIAHRVAWTCFLMPDAVSDQKLLMELAQRSVKGAPGDPWTGMTLGLALYRADQFENAVKKLQPYAEIGWCRIPVSLILAMAHERLGKKEEARRLLDKAVKQMEMEVVAKVRGVLRQPDNAHAWAAYEILRGEAEKLLKK
jgi:tetratricopeptide (TPR) repeat protein